MLKNPPHRKRGFCSKVGKKMVGKHCPYLPFPPRPWKVSHWSPNHLPQHPSPGAPPPRSYEVPKTRKENIQGCPACQWKPTTFPRLFLESPASCSLLCLAPPRSSVLLPQTFTLGISQERNPPPYPPLPLRPYWLAVLYVWVQHHLLEALPAGPT